MGLRELFRTAFAVPAEETEDFTLATADVPTITIGGRTISVLNMYGFSSYVDALPALQRARQMTADTVASLPPVAYRDGAPVAGLPIVRRPDPASHARTFLEETVLSLSDHGNAYWSVTMDDRRQQPIAAKVLDPADVTVYWDRAGDRAYTVNDTQVPPKLIRHLALQRGPWDLLGKGPMQSSRLTGLVNMLQYSEDYFGEASNPSGILTDPYENDPAEAADKLDQWESGHDRGTRMLSGGLSWTPNTLTPGESAWVESHAAGVADIATLYGIPVPLLNAALLGGSSSFVYQSLTMAYEQWYRDSLAPTWIAPITAAWSTLVPRGVHVELDADRLIRRDVAGRTDDAVKAYTAGIIDRDEARAQIGYQASTSASVPVAPPQPNQESIAQ